MSLTIREAFSDEQIEVIITAMNYYQNRCKTNATRKIQGYGSSRELVKREEWAKKAEEVENILSIIVEETI